MARQHPLAALLAQAGADGIVDETRYPIVEAQLAELAIVLREDAETEKFEKGDRVEYKHQRGPFHEKARAGLVFIFWRYLDDRASDRRFIEKMTDGERITLPSPDCLVGYLAEGTFRTEIADSSVIRKIGRVVV